MKSLQSLVLQSVASFATTIVSVSFLLVPSKATALTFVTITSSTDANPTLVFSPTDPEVLTGIDGVQYTLPSNPTVTYTSDFNLVEGTPSSVYGENGTYDFPVSNYADAEYIMQQSASGVANFFITNQGPLYFGTPGNEVYYILYDQSAGGGFDGVVSACDPTTGEYCRVNPQQSQLTPTGDPVPPSDVPFEVPGGATVPVLGSVLTLSAMRKFRNIKKA